MLVVGDSQRREALLSGGELLADTGLFFAGDVVWHGPRHGLLGPLAPLPLDDLDPGLQLRPPVAGCLGVICQIGEQPVADRAGLLVGEAFALPLLDDERLDEVLGEVGQVAGVLVAVPPVAEPVGVLSLRLPVETP